MLTADVLAVALETAQPMAELGKSLEVLLGQNVGGRITLAEHGGLLDTLEHGN